MATVFDTDPIFKIEILTCHLQCFRYQNQDEFGVFHTQTYGQLEQTIATVKDMLWACATEWQGEFDKYLKVAEFAYNNNYPMSTGMTPFETLYGGP